MLDAREMQHAKLAAVADAAARICHWECHRRAKESLERPLYWQLGTS